MSCTADILGIFLHSYNEKPSEMSDEAWLSEELSRNGISDRADAAAILHGVKTYRDSIADLSARIERGESRTRYVRERVESGARASGVSNMAAYANGIDDAVSHANQMMWDTIHRLDGGINQASTLFGNIAEAQIAGSAAINQAAGECSVTTIQPRVNTLGSADAVVYDTSSGQVVSQYQMKYYPTAEETIAAYDAGGYAAKGQALIGPSDQIARIRELRPDIDARASIDGLSDGLPLDRSREIMEDAQERGIISERTWHDADIGLVSKHILGKSVEAGVLAMGLQAASVLGRRTWNAFVGTPNKDFVRDIEALAEDAMKAGAAASLTTAVAGGMVAAARANLLGSAMKAAPLGAISSLACVAVENLKILGQLGRGEITSDQALDKSGDSTCALLGSLAVGAEFAAAGTVLLPGIGMVLGAVVGGVVGNTGGHAIYEGAKRAASAVGQFVSNVASSVKSTVANAWNGFKGLFA